MANDSIGDRMKRYEHASRDVLPPRLPIIMRVDGKAFHTYTKGCERPFDERLMEVMDMVAIALCKEIQGAQIAYLQSDEISILIHPYKRFNSSAWFNGVIQKMASVSAGIASAVFTMNSWKIWINGPEDGTYDFIQYNTRAKLIKPAYFDSRVFVIPEADVCNYFIWRQLDAERNSLQMLARSLYSHKECNNKVASDLQEMCWQKGCNWNDFPVAHRRGRCVVKGKREWLVEDIPRFLQDRNYIEQHLALASEE